MYLTSFGVSIEGVGGLGIDFSTFSNSLRVLSSSSTVNNNNNNNNNSTIIILLLYCLLYPYSSLSVFHRILDRGSCLVSSSSLPCHQQVQN